MSKDRPLMKFRSRNEWVAGRGVLQDFKLTNHHFAENPDFYSNPVLSGHSTPGEIFTINDTLREHLHSLKDVSFTINFNVHNNSKSTSMQGGLFTFTQDKAIGTVQGVQLAYTNVECYSRLYNRDTTIIKWLYFMQPYTSGRQNIYCSAKTDKNVQKWDTNMSITFTFQGNRVRLYANGVLVNMPDSRGKGYIEYTRHPIDVTDKIQIPYNTQYNGDYNQYAIDADYFGDVYSLTFFGRALSEQDIKNRMIFDEKRFNIKFGETTTWEG